MAAGTEARCRQRWQVQYEGCRAGRAVLQCLTMHTCPPPHLLRSGVDGGTGPPSASMPLQNLGMYVFVAVGPKSEGIAGFHMRAAFREELPPPPPPRPPPSPPAPPPVGGTWTYPIDITDSMPYDSGVITVRRARAAQAPCATPALQPCPWGLKAALVAPSPFPLRSRSCCPRRPSPAGRFWPRRCPSDSTATSSLKKWPGARSESTLNRRAARDAPCSRCWLAQAATPTLRLLAGEAG